MNLSVPTFCQKTTQFYNSVDLTLVLIKLKTNLSYTDSFSNGKHLFKLICFCRERGSFSQPILCSLNLIILWTTYKWALLVVSINLWLFVHNENCVWVHTHIATNNNIVYVLCQVVQYVLVRLFSLLHRCYRMSILSVYGPCTTL